jgi:hypothetical protein
VPKGGSRLFENDSAFLAAVGFLKMTRLFEKADQLLAMSRRNVITGLTFSRHSSGISGSFQHQSIHGDAESCMFAACKCLLHVLQWLQEDGAPWDSSVISCAEEHGYDYVVEWARENGCPEPKARQNVIMYYSGNRYTASVPGAFLQSDYQYFFLWAQYYNTKPLDCNANCGGS